MHNRRRRDKARRWAIRVASAGATLIAVVATLLVGGRGVHETAPHSAQVLAETPFGGGEASASLTQVITVERPAGELTVSMVPTGSAGEVDITVTDTRAGDRGWELRTGDAGGGHPAARLQATSIKPTPSFSDAAGFVYAQRVNQGRGHVVADAPAGHGLGIAHIRAIVSSPGTRLSDVVITAV